MRSKETSPIDQVKVELGYLLDGLRGGKQMPGPLGGQELAIVGPERERAVAVPDQFEQGIGTPPIAGGLDAAACREAPVPILGGAQGPAMCRPIVLQLERLILADLILVGRHIDALLHAHIPQVQAGNEGGLRQRVLQREELVPGHRRGAGLEHRLRANGRQVLALAIAQCQVSAMVFGAEQTVLVAQHLQLSIGVQISVEYILFRIYFSQLNPQGNSLVVARVQGIASALLGTELEGEKRILAPRNVGIHMDLILRLREMRESLASNGTQINLRPGGQVDRPELTGAGRLGRTDQLVGRAAKEVAARLVLQRPTAAAVLADADLEAAARVPFVALAQHVAKLIDRKVLVQMRS